MKRPVRQEDGLYHVNKKTFEVIVGSRREVMNGKALKTPGGLTTKDLIMSHGRIVSLKKHKTAKKEKRLEKFGYFAEKGKFGYVKRNVKSRKSRKSEGGKKGGAKDLSPADFVSGGASTLSPAEFKSEDVTVKAGEGKSDV